MAEMTFKKGDKLLRRFSEGMIERLKETFSEQKIPLSARLASWNPLVRQNALKEAEELMKVAMKDLDQMSYKTAGLAFAHTLGVASLVLMAVFATGPVSLVAGIAFFVISLALFIRDMVVFVEHVYKAKTATSKEERWSLYAAVVSGVSLAAMVVLFSLFSFGAIPIALGTIFGVIWFAVSLSAYYEVRAKNRQDPDFALNEEEREAMQNRIKEAKKKHWEAITRVFESYKA